MTDVASFAYRGPEDTEADMKSTFGMVGALAVALVLAAGAGCSKKSEAGRLEAEFSGLTNAPVKGNIDTAVAALRAKDYDAAKANLQRALGQPGMTEAQRQAVMQTLTMVLQLADKSRTNLDKRLPAPPGR